MKVKKNKAKFFCEYCDTEVPQNAKFCPRCGHFFASVRCPACGKTGDHSEFTNGCPSCGYAFSSQPASKKDTSENETKFLSKKAGWITRNRAKKAIDSSPFTSAKKRPNRKDDSLPYWVYILSLAMLAALVTALLLSFE